MRRPNPKRAALAVTALAFHVDTLLYCLLVPLLPRYEQALGLSQLQAGALFWVYALTLLLSTVPLARVTDRCGRRAPMLWGLGGLAFATLVFAYSRSYTLLVTARALQGIACAATWVPGMALVADHFPKEERGGAMGVIFAGANLGLLIGPPLSGLLDRSFGPMAPFQLGIVLVLLDGLARAFLLKDAAPVREEVLPWRVLLRSRVVVVFAGAAVLGSGLFTLLESALPLDLARRFKLDPRGIGFIFAAAALAHALSSPLMGRLSDRIGRAKVLRLGLASSCVVLPLPALLPGPWSVGGAMLLLGVYLSFLVGPCSAAVADQVERMQSQSFASGFSLLNLAYAGGMVLGPLLGGFLVQAFGFAAALGVLGLLFTAGLAFTRALPA